MHILAPVSRYQDILPLIDAGADEFYCGIIPEQVVYKDINCHAGDTASNFSSYNELQKSIDVAHAHRKKLFVTLNMPFIIPEQYRDIDSLLGTIIKIQTDAIIVSDIGFLNYVKARYPGLETHLSVVAGATNTYAIDFFREMGVQRIVLPDHLSLEEIEQISARKQNLAIEIFVLNNKCFNWECVCGFHHWPVSDKPRIPLPVDFLQKTFSLLPAHMVEKLFNLSFIQNLFEIFLQSQKHLQGCKLNYTVSLSPGISDQTHLLQQRRIQQLLRAAHSWRRMNQCGACSLFMAKTYGIDVIKLDGRYLPLERKVKDVSFIRRCHDALDCTADKNEFSRICKEEFKNIYGYPCRTQQCYYPELFQNHA
ncbi:MAG: U32 family peptidase [Candidatus Omnitrophica bacterium]|nr:U32 family peptidase [Candidatus Omnitrophota bacterium]